MVSDVRRALLSTHTTSTPVKPAAHMVRFEGLIGEWEMSGGVSGRATYQWLPGGFFVLATVSMTEHGHLLEGVNVIGHTRPWRGAPSSDARSRMYDSDGNTLDYVYDVVGDKLLIWAGERDSETYFVGTFSADGTEISGSWRFVGGGGYDYVMRRVV